MERKREYEELERKKRVERKEAKKNRRIDDEWKIINEMRIAKKKEAEKE